jgi:hypothetical protein
LPQARGLLVSGTPRCACRQLEPHHMVCLWLHDLLSSNCTVVGSLYARRGGTLESFPPPVMQCPPPRPGPSSNPSMVIGSMPALRGAVLVPVFRSKAEPVAVLP